MKKVIHISDDESIGSALKAFLIKSNIEYNLIPDIPEDNTKFMNLVLSEKPDLILMDIVMPKINGIEATKILKNDPNTKSIAIIGFGNIYDEKTTDEAKKCGMEDYIWTNNISLVRLVERISMRLHHPDEYNKKGEERALEDAKFLLGQNKKDAEERILKYIRDERIGKFTLWIIAVIIVISLLVWLFYFFKR